MRNTIGIGISSSFTGQPLEKSGLSINLTAHARQLNESYHRVLAETDPLKWAVYCYDANTYELKLEKTGETGLNELTEQFDDNRIQFAFVKAIEPATNILKTVLISWCGDHVPVSKKALFISHSRDVEKLFKSHHVHITARTRDDIAPEVILRKVKDSAGLKYTYQNPSAPTANPSVSATQDTKAAEAQSLSSSSTAAAAPATPTVSNVQPRTALPNRPYPLPSTSVGPKPVVAAPIPTTPVKQTLPDNLAARNPYLDAQKRDEALQEKIRLTREAREAAEAEFRARAEEESRQLEEKQKNPPNKELEKRNSLAESESVKPNQRARSATTGSQNAPFMRSDTEKSINTDQAKLDYKQSSKSNSRSDLHQTQHEDKVTSQPSKRNSVGTYGLAKSPSGTGFVKHDTSVETPSSIATVQMSRSGSGTAILPSVGASHRNLLTHQESETQLRRDFDSKLAQEKERFAQVETGLRDEIKKLETENGELRLSLENERQTVRDLRTKVTDAESQIWSLRSENAQLKEAAHTTEQRLQSETERLTNELHQLRQTHEATYHAKETAEKLARERAEQLAREEAERVAREQAERFAAEEIQRKAKEEAERVARETAERVAREEAERHARQEAERKAREETERRAREEAEHKAREEAERKAREETERKLREEIERKAREEIERKVREEIELKARQEAERKAREEAERHAHEEAERKAREEAERRAQEEAQRLAQQEAERKAMEEAERKAREEAEKKAREESERKAKEEAERKAKEEAERKAKEEAERKAREEAERKAKEEAERKAKEEAERKAREESERKAREEAERKAREEAERKAREESERQAREEAERKAKEEAERKAKMEAERKAREEAERKAREESERKAREEAERKAKEEAERKAREEAERKAREEAERKAHEEAERKAREESERKAREESERLARLEAERLAREEAERKVREEKERAEREEAERKAKEEAERQALEDARRQAELIMQEAEKLVVVQPTAVVEPSDDKASPVDLASAYISPLSARVVYPWVANEANEVTVHEEEIVTNVIQLDPGWWQVTSPRGETGLVPSNYLELLPEEQVAQLAQQQAEPSNCIAAALYDYNASEENELSFSAGEQILSVTFASAEWWHGYCRDKWGLFPANYVELVEGAGSQ